MGPADWGVCTRTISCQNSTHSLAYWNNTVATGSTPQDITIFDALTGSQTAVLSGHTECIRSLAFSLDGALLISGSKDKTIKLWDVQTGGVVKTFYGHTNWVNCVSISPDNTMIASGSGDNKVHLWNIKTGSHSIIKRLKDDVNAVTFSPTNSQLLLSSSNDGIIQQWGIDGHKIGPPIAGSHVVFSPDGTQFVSCKGVTVTIRDTNSRVTVVEFNLANNANHCCFSPDGGLIAAAADHTIYLWDIIGHNPCLIQTLIGHADSITSLVFSSSLTLISASQDKLIKFWQIDVLLVDQVARKLKYTPLTSAPIKFVSLQAKVGLAFSIDSAGVVKIWDISSGHCKESHNTQAIDISYGDMQLIGDRLIIVWCKWWEGKIHICDVEKGKHQIVYVPCWMTRGLRITGDGTRVLQLDQGSIQAWYISTGELAGRKRLEKGPEYLFDPLCMDGSKVLVCSGESSAQGWDFGTLGSIPIQFSETSYRPPLNFIAKSSVDNSPARIEDTVTEKEVFQLCGRYANPSTTQWDGQYLIAGYESGEVFILDFSCVSS